MTKPSRVLYALSFLIIFQNCTPASFTGESVATTAVDGPIDNELIVDDPTNGLECKDECEDSKHRHHKEVDDFSAYTDRGCHTCATPKPTPKPTPTPKPECKCSPVDMAKLLVNVNRIELAPAGVTVPVPADTVVDLLLLDSEGFKFGPLPANASTRYVRLVLNDFGNKIITPGNTEVKLTTPSPMNTSVLLDLGSEVPLEAGKSYLIQATFDADSPIIRKDGSCTLQLRITVTAIQEALD